MASSHLGSPGIPSLRRCRSSKGSVVNRPILSLEIIYHNILDLYIPALTSSISGLILLTKTIFLNRKDLEKRYQMFFTFDHKIPTIKEKMG